MGRRRPQSPQRDVRPGDLGCPKAAAGARAGPLRDQAPVLQDRRRAPDFGSEIRALHAATPARREIDATCLNLFLRYRYTPSPYTLFKDVRKLAPGTKL